MIPHDQFPRSGEGAEQPPDDSERARLAAIAKFEFHNRRRRDSLIRHDLFAEPAWDLLLDLYVQHHEGRPADVEHLCQIAAVMPTTAIRWIGLLMEQRLVIRLPHGGDGAGAQVVLSTHGVEEMERYLRDFLHREQLGGDIAAALSAR